jgi:hypothetical protein
VDGDSHGGEWETNNKRYIDHTLTRVVYFLQSLDSYRLGHCPRRTSLVPFTSTGHDFSTTHLVPWYSCPSDCAEYMGSLRPVFDTTVRSCCRMRVGLLISFLINTMY